MQLNRHSEKYAWIASLLLAAGAAGPALAWAGNEQVVHSRGAIINSAASGGTAVMNISSTQGVPVPAGNRQITDVNGVILNSADSGGQAEMNIASRTREGSSGSQVISIQGPVINQASGGQTSTMNIGSR